MFFIFRLQRKFPAKFFNNFLILSSRFVFVTSPVEQLTKMGWESEKEKYLALFDTKDTKDSVKLADIKTWKQFAKEMELPKSAVPFPGSTLDSSRNSELADKISMFSGDITKLKVDAIVNAANSHLKRGGGVDGAIHRVAGEFLQQECDTLNGCPTGEAKITGGYELPSKYVILTVGPQGENPQALKNCYTNSLKLAMENNLRTIAFPCISTGVYGYPNDQASHVASSTVRQVLERHSDKFDRIIFCTFLPVDVNLYKQVLQTYFPIN